VSPQVRIEAIDEDRFLATGQGEDGVVEVRVLVEEGFVDRVGLQQTSGADIAEATIAYLLGHQRIDELPPQLELEDVAAAYDDFEEELRRTLAGG